MYKTLFHVLQATGIYIFRSFSVMRRMTVCVFVGFERNRTEITENIFGRYSLNK